MHIARRLLGTVLCLMAGMPSTPAADAASDDPVRFFPDARIMSLQMGGEDIVREARERNGFAVLLFDGRRIREMPLMRVTRSDAGWVLQGEKKDLPRFTCRFATFGAQVEVRLVRMEGVPPGMDATLVLRLGTRKPLLASGTGVDIEAQKDALAVHWRFIGAPEALTSFGPVAIGVRP